MSSKNGSGRKWTYCACTGQHAKGCPNAGKPDALPPLAGDDE